MEKKRFRNPWGVVIFMTILVFPSLFYGESTAGINRNLVKAVLEKDWHQVILECESQSKTQSSPVLSALWGHACLATNQNNKSYCFFLFLDQDKARQAWLEWSCELVEKYPDSCVSYYLKGDAFARLKEWDNALGELEKSLEINPKFSLAANAKGVVLLAMGKSGEAKKEMERTCREFPDLADSHSTLGTYWLYNRGIIAAKEYFSHALTISPDFALALNGQACCHFFSGPSQWDIANDEFTSAAKCCPVNAFAANLDQLGQAAADTRSKTHFSFSPHDFTNWEKLRNDIAQKDSLLFPYFANQEIPQAPTRLVTGIFNQILEDKDFYSNNQSRIRIKLENFNSPQKIRNLEELVLLSKPVREKNTADLNGYDRSVVREFNRTILEALYQDLIKQSQEANPGMTLTKSGQIAVNAFDYKSSLSTPEIVAGQHRMNYLYGPMANFVEAVPIIGSIGKNWNNHLTTQSNINKEILTSRNAPDSIVHPGGVSTRELMNAFFKREDWKMSYGFGLGYPIELP